MTPSRSRSKPPNLTSNRDFRCARTIGEAILVPGKKKPCASSCSKGTNTGFGWAQKSNVQRFPCIFMTPMGNWQKSQMDGRKVTSRLRTLFRKLLAVTSSSSVEESPEERTHWALVYG